MRAIPIVQVYSIFMQKITPLLLVICKRDVDRPRGEHATDGRRILRSREICQANCRYDYLTKTAYKMYHEPNEGLYCEEYLDILN